MYPDRRRRLEQGSDSNCTKRRNDVDRWALYAIGHVSDSQGVNFHCTTLPRD